MRLVTAWVTEALETLHGVQRLVAERPGDPGPSTGAALADSSAGGAPAGGASSTDGAPAAERPDAGAPSPSSALSPRRYRALRYEALAAECRVGDKVLLNTTAVDLALGTGGMCLVVVNLTALERAGAPPRPAFDGSAPALAGTPAPALAGTPAPALAGAPPRPASAAPAFDDGRGGREAGHLMKLRYTPFQHEVLSVEEPASPHHEALARAASLKGAPVVCCELHSQVPLVAAAVKRLRPEAHVVYCMTDEAALLAAFSELLARMRQVGLIDACVTCGQALGGDLEAVNLYSGMLAATAVCGADVIICAQGPGIVGTTTRFGHGGLAQAQALNAAAALDGVPIAPLRLSFADERERHRGVSHHTLTTLGRACLAQAIIPLPDDLPAEQSAQVEHQLEEEGILERHGLVRVAVEQKPLDLRGVRVTTMGRTQDDDPAFFSAALAAGTLAARLLDEKA